MLLPGVASITFGVQSTGPIDLDALESKLVNGLKNKNPKSSLAYCLANKKTIRLGNKADASSLLKRSTGGVPER